MNNYNFSDLAEHDDMVTCPECGVELEFPKGAYGIMECPECGTSFYLYEETIREIMF
jgi:predicted  nucleic acid-binding Zn-ribbon protein